MVKSQTIPFLCTLRRCAYTNAIVVPLHHEKWEIAYVITFHLSYETHEMNIYERFYIGLNLKIGQKMLIFHHLNSSNFLPADRTAVEF